MSGITSSVGIFSGIDTGSLIDQLIAAASKPKQLVQQRIQELQVQKASYLGLNSKISALAAAAKAFRSDKVFQANTASTSNSDVLSATASNDASPGVYKFIVNQLVTTQQVLSRGFGDKDTSGIGASQFTFESDKGHISQDVALSDLNGGNGVQRGKIVVTDSQNHAATVDLSKAATIDEVVDLINNNGTALVTASVDDDHLVIKDKTNPTNGAISITDATGYKTATQLGIAKSGTGSITGDAIHYLGDNTLLSQLNDGNGVYTKITTTDSDYTFQITLGGTKTVKVNTGDVQQYVDGKLIKTAPAASTVGEVVKRINDALKAAGENTVSASIDQANGRLKIQDTADRTIAVTENGGYTTAKDLGIAGTFANGDLQGRRVMSGIDTTLATSLNGGAGVGGDGTLNITARDGTAFSFSIDTKASLASIARTVSQQTGGKITLSVNTKGTGLLATDTTGSTASNLIITGTNGSDTAASLGIATGAAGVAANTVAGSNLQRKYISNATLLSSLNDGKGLGTGAFTVTDSNGLSKSYNVTSSVTTVGDLLNFLNDGQTKVSFAINSTGDGIIATDGGNGTSKIKISDTSGAVAKALNLAGEAAGSGASNVIDGSFERKVSFSPTDTLTQVVQKINAANAGVQASIVKDGTGATPYRIAFTASSSGKAGRFTIDTGGFNLGTTTIEKGQDAKVFFGSNDPAQGLLLSSSTNSIDDAVSGLKVDLKSTSDTAVNVTVDRDQSKVESEIDAFVAAFNDLTGSIDNSTKYDKDTGQSGPLLGDSTAISLRDQLFSTLQSSSLNTTGRFRKLSEIGMSIGANGNLQINKDQLHNAMSLDRDAVVQLFTTYDVDTSTTKTVGTGNTKNTVNDPNAKPAYNALGVMGLFERFGDNYVSSIDGILTNKSKSIDDEITDQNNRVTDLQAQLDQKRSILQSQFLAMEQAIGNMKQQSAAMGSIGTSG